MPSVVQERRTFFIEAITDLDSFGLPKTLRDRPSNTAETILARAEAEARAMQVRTDAEVAREKKLMELEQKLAEDEQARQRAERIDVADIANKLVADLAAALDAQIAELDPPADFTA